MPLCTWRDAIRARLIDDWRRSWRFWSMRLSLIGAVLATAGAAFPDAMLEAWNALPPDLRALVPTHAARIIAATLFVATMAARLYRQGARHDG
ncbi:MAG: hypothetical protein ACTHJR_03865 [Sphingomonas sp.]|uniref:DUF7940 domain-containing protein n=1 Tax=Sphingomonas sp. TaxID=28214 RepID=UPI003F7E1271